MGRKGLKLAAGAVLLATLLYALTAAPGLLTDDALTIPAGHLEVRR